MPSPKRVLVAFHIPEALRDVLAGITRFAKEEHRNWQLLAVNADEFEMNFARQRSDGAIVQVRPESKRLIRRLARSTTPVVNLLRKLRPAIPAVLSDDRAIGRLGATYLQSIGFRKMAFVSLNTSWSRNRELGFTEALRDADLRPPVTTGSLGVGDFRFISHGRASRLLGKWAKSLGPGFAIMAPSDFVAQSLLIACQAQGIEVPKDVAILGVDNFPTICELSPIPITSIAQDFARMGFEAAKMLDGLMIGQSKAIHQPVHVPPGRLHVRASTNVLAFDDPLVADALRAIHEPGISAISMNDLLRRVPLSRRWLDHRFKMTVGHTAAEEFRRLKLRRVRDLLIETDLPLRQIATRCGFSFIENLSRAFRKTYGMPPHVYRLKHRTIQV